MVGGGGRSSIAVTKLLYKISLVYTKLKVIFIFTVILNTKFKPRGIVIFVKILQKWGLDVLAMNPRSESETPKPKGEGWEQVTYLIVLYAY